MAETRSSNVQVAIQAKIDFFNQRLAQITLEQSQIQMRLAALARAMEFVQRTPDVQVIIAAAGIELVI